ncbi:sensor histidine kinase [Streptomyces sp. NPDC058751]|uniref:sensor histidine kinase n=1 Tax=Streptomyces sp. NPDC058751 TaxID=3346623 RepID=UPI003692BF7C
MQLLQAVRRQADHVIHSLGAERPFTRRRDLLLLAVLLAPSAIDVEGLAAAPVGWLAVSLLITAAVAVRRAVPLLSLALAGSIVLFYVALGSNLWTAGATVVLSFVAGRRVTRLWPAHAVFLGVAAVGLLLVNLFAEPKDWLSLLLTEFFTCVLPWWAGDWWRQRSDLTRAGWDRAEQLEWKGRFVAEQARLKERARIAQDIHDSLGHELSVMALLAGGLELARDLTDEQRRTVTQLRERCTMATERLHEVIGLLREDSTPSLRPAHESISDLVRRFERSGMPVRFREDGGEQRRPPLLTELAAYRVVQEALTNATKHAAGAPITVRLGHRVDDTVVSVFNELPSGGDEPAPSGSRMGLIGLDERVRLAGGTLRAGPRRGGFEVRAELPHEPSARALPVEEAHDEDAGGGGPDAAGPDADGTRGGLDALGQVEEGLLCPAAEGARSRRSASRTALARARARVRRNARRAALLPVLLGAALVLVLAGLYVFTSAMTSLSPRNYHSMRLGESRRELAPVLPERRIRKPPPVVTDPPAPPGAACEYYRAADSVLSLTDTLYRLCFKDDVLVAKDTL